MSINCTHCQSNNTQKRGTRTNTDGSTFIRGYCKDCQKFFAIPTECVEPETVKSELNFVRGGEYIKTLLTYDKFVVTTAVNNSQANEKFLQSLELYCKVNDAALVVIPIVYRNVSLFENSDDYWFDETIVPYLVQNNFNIAPNVRILGGLKTQATVANPLNGIDAASKGSNVIIGHTQVALKTMPRLTEKYPPIAATTGAITRHNYSDTKVGYIANFNHSMSACVIELDEEHHFIRHLNFDGFGFYDLEHYYTDEDYSDGHEVDALIMGDLHVAVKDDLVEKATFDNDDSICNVLRPKNILIHDFLDFGSSNHHSRNNIFISYAKSINGANCVKSELDETLKYISEVVPDYATGWIVASNHNDALKRWLNEIEIKREVHNALIYHLLMYKMLEKTDMVDGIPVSPDPFSLYAEHIGVPSNIKFLGRLESLKIHDIELSQHGDSGINGARGSTKSFSDLGPKIVAGHQHSPSIMKGAYIVGTSSKLRLEYNSGLSTWDHAHVVIHPNGERQMIFMRDGKWRK